MVSWRFYEVTQTTTTTTTFEQQHFLNCRTKFLKSVMIHRLKRLLDRCWAHLKVVRNCKVRTVRTNICEYSFNCNTTGYGRTVLRFSVLGIVSFLSRDSSQYLRTVRCDTPRYSAKRKARGVPPRDDVFASCGRRVSDLEDLDEISSSYADRIGYTQSWGLFGTWTCRRWSIRDTSQI